MIQSINNEGDSMKKFVLFVLISVSTLFGREGFIGEIAMFGGNFAPRGWALCDGQLLSIAGNDALFSILGTTYGGDGRTTFGLPDLRGRVAVHAGDGPGLPSKRLGSKGGSTAIGLTTLSKVVNDTEVKKGRNVIGEVNTLIKYTADAPVQNVEPPYQVVNYIICLQGIYPPRS